MITFTYDTKSPAILQLVVSTVIVYIVHTESKIGDVVDRSPDSVT